MQSFDRLSVFLAYRCVGGHGLAPEGFGFMRYLSRLPADGSLAHSNALVAATGRPHCPSATTKCGFKALDAAGAIVTKSFGREESLSASNWVLVDFSAPINARYRGRCGRTAVSMSMGSLSGVSTFGRSRWFWSKT